MRPRADERAGLRDLAETHGFLPPWAAQASGANTSPSHIGSLRCNRLSSRTCFKEPCLVPLAQKRNACICNMLSVRRLAKQDGVPYVMMKFKTLTVVFRPWMPLSRG